METTNSRPNLLWGVTIGALFTPLMIAIFYIGERFADLPFLPLNFFDAVARILPGPLITFGIDTMVDLLIATGFGADLDSAAKTAEQLLGLGLFFGLSVVVSGLFFLILNLVNYKKVSYIPGVVFALAFAIPILMLAIPRSVASSAAPEMKVIWSLLVFIGFGTAIGWAYNAMAFPAIAVKSKTGEATTEGINRREFIVRVGGASATLTVVGAGLGALLGPSNSDGVSSGDVNLANTNVDLNNLPNADSPVIPAPGTRAELTAVADHYRIDILSGGLPSIPEDYTLPISGLVENEVEWTLEEIMDLPSQSEFITMSCISNRIAGSLISTTKWTGVSFREILDIVQPTEEASAIRIIGYDDFDEYVDLDLIRNDDRIMLAYHFNDQPLPLRNGFPLRIHIPNRYGMKQPKWIHTIEFVSEWEPGYWVRRGWSQEAIVNQTSVIDTVASSETFVNDAGTTMVPIGGIAWAGDREIVNVEVRINEGEWQTAEIREPLSVRAWTIWRYDWEFEAGSHTVEVRSYEASGEAQSDPILQPTQRRGTRPDGAIGIHAEEFTLASTESADALPAN
ncbi:MAG: molybdopterin-dependent oxidoreductase [Chloroflexota bacterium]